MAGALLTSLKKRLGMKTDVKAKSTTKEKASNGGMLGKAKQAIKGRTSKIDKAVKKAGG